MTMYAEFLELALYELEKLHRGLDGPERDAALTRRLQDCRQSLDRKGTKDREVSGSIAVQVGYDAVLVLLCRGRGIEFDLSRFARPQLARQELEAALAANPSTPPVNR